VATREATPSPFCIPPTLHQESRLISLLPSVCRMTACLSRLRSARWRAEPSSSTTIHRIQRSPSCAGVYNIVHRLHWLTRIANKSTFVSTPVYIRLLTSLRGRGSMTADNAMSYSHDNKILRYQIHATTEDVAQWSSLTVSRPPQQPLHRLSHLANHTSSTIIASSRRPWPTETPPNVVGRQDTTKQCLGNSATTCLCAVVLRVRLPARADVGYAVDGLECHSLNLQVATLQTTKPKEAI
jgi:hypothetical protein